MENLIEEKNIIQTIKEAEENALTEIEKTKKTNENEKIMAEKQCAKDKEKIAAYFRDKNETIENDLKPELEKIKNEARTKTENALLKIKKIVEENSEKAVKFLMEKIKE
ncbi:MAG: hypothetical protein AAB397_00185 [Patescibacteria group bacterium]